ncbi:SOS response-associated peptidase [bacterium]|nr:SOS response-associated peptidase [bacterium]
MCGRFVQSADPSEYAGYFGADVVVSEVLKPSYNVAPTDAVYAVAEHGGERQLGAFRWGLLPFWAKDRKIAARHINARSETVVEKPAFRDAFVSKRCIIPADGFYEWQRIEDKGKLPHFIHAGDRSPLALAGLWSVWRDPETGDRIATCTIVTTDPNDLLRPIHDRMPVILDPSAWDLWLDREFDDVDALRQMLIPAPEGRLAEHPVSSLVNSVRNNVPDLIEPLR